MHNQTFFTFWWKLISALSVIYGSLLYSFWLFVLCLQIQEHLSRCPLTVVSCTFANVGCTKQVFLTLQITFFVCLVVFYKSTKKKKKQQYFIVNKLSHLFVQTWESFFGKHKSLLVEILSFTYFSHLNWKKVKNYYWSVFFRKYSFLKFWFFFIFLVNRFFQISKLLL